MTRLWLVRLGKHGEYENAAFEENLLTIAFGAKEGVAQLKNLDALVSKMAELFPNDKLGRQRNQAAQVNQFLNVAQAGDLVVSPVKSNSTIAIGRIKGGYAPGPKGEVTRPVQWLKTGLSRDTFRQDLLYSFGAIMSVCEIRRNDALNRIQQVLATGVDPGDGSVSATLGKTSSKTAAETEEATDQAVNLDLIARDQIEQRIASVFTGHDFTRLVAAVLTALGYSARVSPPGPDKGVDIVAGSGPLGLDSPRLVAQVKSGKQVVDQPTLQGLLGSIQDVHANHGLIVSWGGFTDAVRRRVNELFFRVRLWGREELVDNLFATYERLPEDIRAELPLKRSWMLVLEEEGEPEA